MLVAYWCKCGSGKRIVGLTLFVFLARSEHGAIAWDVFIAVSAYQSKASSSSLGCLLTFVTVLPKSSNPRP